MSARPPAPPGVRVGIGALALFLLVRLAVVIQGRFTLTGYVLQGVSLFIGLLVLWGFVAGHRLAWQWGNLLALLGALLFSFVGVHAWTRGVHAATPLALAGAHAALLWTVYATTLRASARSYFRLICPSCGRCTRKSADLFFEKAECGACRTVW